MDITSRAESKAARHREFDATESVRFQLYSQAEANPKATQQLAQWFNDMFKKQIKQSTVSRMIYFLLSWCEFGRVV